MFYIAYGSNLNRRQMSRRCPDAEPIGPLQLKDWRLVFRGVADVEFHEGSVVHAGLWRITKRCERALDAYEGVSSGLYLKEYVGVAVTVLGKDVVDGALVYIMNRARYELPSIGYYEAIEEGYKDFGLPVEALEQALAETRTLIRPTRSRTRRRPAAKVAAP